MMLSKYDDLLDHHIRVQNTNATLKEELIKKDAEIDILKAKLHDRDYTNLQNFRRQKERLYMHPKHEKM